MSHVCHWISKNEVSIPKGVVLRIENGTHPLKLLIALRAVYSFLSEITLELNDLRFQKYVIEETKSYLYTKFEGSE